MLNDYSVVLSADWNGVPASSVMNIILIDDAFALIYNPSDAGNWPGAVLSMRLAQSTDKIIQLTPSGS